MERFNKLAAIKAQRDFCSTTGNPHFAPSDGNCWSCRMNIYDKKTTQWGEKGITVESAGRSLVTGCPHCNRSYCD